MGRHAEALAAFSSGLAQVHAHDDDYNNDDDYNHDDDDDDDDHDDEDYDGIVNFQDPKSLQLLAGLVEAAMKSPLRGDNFYVMMTIAC